MAIQYSLVSFHVLLDVLLGCLLVQDPCNKASYESKHSDQVSLCLSKRNCTTVYSLFYLAGREHLTSPFVRQAYAKILERRLFRRRPLWAEEKVATHEVSVGANWDKWVPNDEVTQYGPQSRQVSCCPKGERVDAVKYYRRRKRSRRAVQCVSSLPVYKLLLFSFFLPVDFNPLSPCASLPAGERRTKRKTRGLSFYLSTALKAN